MRCPRARPVMLGEAGDILVVVEVVFRFGECVNRDWVAVGGDEKFTFVVQAKLVHHAF